MGGVPDNHVCLGNLLHHPAEGHLALDPTYPSLNLRIALCLLEFILHFLLGHLKVPLILPALVKEIKESHYAERHADLDHQVKGHV